MFLQGLSKFKDICDCTPSLFSTLLVTESFSEVHLEALMRWIHKHRAVEILVALNDSPSLEIVLGSLLASNMLAGVPKTLAEASIYYVENATVKVFWHFPTLTTLELSAASPDKQVCLHGLQYLPHLTILVLLDGKFADIHNLSHVKILTLDSCRVHCDKDC